MSDKTSFESVREFYEGFEQTEFIGKRPSFDEDNISEERVHLKMNLISEEFIELTEAVYGKAAAAVLKVAWKIAQGLDDGTRDIVETADALADMDYVEKGFALELGVPADDVFREVHRSNMSKLGEDGKPVISDGVTPAAYDGEVKPKGKLLKGPNYSEPDIRGVLGI